MQEREVTISRQTYSLPDPFFVMATENPLEVSGVYSLPEAQIDRFLFKLLIGYPESQEEKMVLRKNTTTMDFESYDLKAVLNPSMILNLQERVKKVFASEAIEEYIIRIVAETRKKDWDYGKYISYGASPRASIALFIASKAEALMHGRDYVTPEDVKAVVYPVLRHRIILNYEAEAEEITTDKVIGHILNAVSVP
jgi:MoxR-like ATPase